MQKSLEDFLGASDGAGKIMAHARLLTKLAQLYTQIAPSHLCQASVLANYKSGVVVIHAGSGAVAAKLRQMAPSLAEAFSKRGVECNGIQVKVQALDMPGQSAGGTVKPLSPRATRTLSELRDGLRESPLKAAIDGLIQRAATQATKATKE